MSKIFKPTYLYVKTHNITGLKYFGKTVVKDPFKYLGSGTRWRNHLEKHGNDISTEIIGLFYDEDECKKVALQFSIDNNIVESPNWANLKLEILDGGWDHITKEHNKRGIETFKSRPQEEQDAVNKKKSQPGRLNGMYGIDRSGKNNPRYGVTLSEEQKQKSREKMKGKVNGVLPTGEIIHVKCDDIRFTTGELKHIGVGKTLGKLITGETICVECDDPRFKTGELIHPNVGKKRTDSEKQHLSKIVSTLKWYNNGKETIRRTESPGQDWVRGRLPKIKYFSE